MYSLKYGPTVALIKHSILDCGPDTMVADPDSGPSFGEHFSVENIFTLHDTEVHDGPNTNYWIAPTDTAATLIINLGCKHTFDAIFLVNTHNAHHRDRGAKEFRLVINYYAIRY